MRFGRRMEPAAKQSVMYEPGVSFHLIMEGLIGFGHAQAHHHSRGDVERGGFAI